MTSRDEDWRAIDDAPDYAVSNKGRVKRIKPDWQGKYGGRILKPSIHRGGYLAHVLCVDGKRITRKVHRLVCAAFNGPPPSTIHHAAHFDGDTANNAPQNLYWASALENAADRERHGRTARGDASGAALHPERWTRGSDHWTVKSPERVIRGAEHYARRNPTLVPRGGARHNAKLTEAQALEIINAPRTYGSGRQLADQFGVTMGLVTAIRNGRAWSHLARPK